MGIKVDCREALLIRTFAETSPDTVIAVEQLPLADAIITNAENATVALLERKTFSDFCSSLTSGRYKEQRDRLLSVRTEDPTIAIAYLLEGFHQWHLKMKRDPSLTKRVHGALENMVFRHNIAFYPTADAAHTCGTIINLSKKLSENRGTTGSAPLPARKVTVREHLFPSQLALITGVSSTTATSITQTLYPSAHALVMAIAADKEAVQKSIAEHKPKTRKLGATVARNIVDAFS